VYIPKHKATKHPIRLFKGAGNGIVLVETEVLSVSTLVFRYTKTGRKLTLYGSGLYIEFARNIYFLATLAHLLGDPGKVGV